MTSHAPSDRQRLLDLFSAAANSNVELVVHEANEPDAPAALRAWASSVERRVYVGHTTVGEVTWVETGANRRGIQVYSRAA